MTPGGSGRRVSGADAAPATEWKTVFTALFGGVAAATHIGKASAALPIMQSELAIDLRTASVYLALISLMAALGGFWFGALTGRLYPVRSGMAGLAAIAAGSAATTLSHSVTALLLGRFMEAAGFALVITAMPSIAQAAASPGQKSTVMGIWASWQPAGVGLSMFLSLFLLEPFGWRPVYWVCAGFCMIAAMLLLRVPERRVESAMPPAISVLRRKTVTVAGIFVLFSSANLIVVGFLPVFLVERQEYSPSIAVLITMIAALMLVPANLLAGRLVDTGVSQRLLFVMSLGGMAIFAHLTLAVPLPAEAKLAAIFLFGICAGFPPTLVWAHVPILARNPREAPLISGVLYQGAGIGQLIGPVAAGWAVQLSGNWMAASIVVAIAMAAAILLSCLE